ncbi:MAG: FKBP-type peptidyl-prolyl cis-trans isomerase [Hahellaceae bacterium]|nr:FKBP-type peptidyl-prolyl cis-trans isomerase [Hahellaceae bacterium]
MASDYVGHGSKVTLHFALRLEDGEVVDSTFDKQPGELEFGDGTLPGGFESLIQGMKAGERKVFDVAPENGFGMPNPTNVQRFRRNDFPQDLDLLPGMVFSFADAQNAELPGIIKTVAEDEVIVDFNHPLSGHHLQFEVEILEVSSVEAE